MKSWRGKIVAMVIMIVIVLLSSGGGYRRVGTCCWGVGGEGELKIAQSGYHAVFCECLFLLFLFTSMSLMG